ncbi:MAG: DUF420 domain-containing protein [Ignavibacteria bacterium]|nr:DUF420 domain-containing protein [Ignavibacteria bacterium]
MELTDLPLLNAILNTTCLVLLVTGWIFIRSGNREAHRRCMLGAVLASSLFLLSYLIYHFNVGSVKFTGEGSARTVYFAILLTHTILAMTLPVLVPITVVRGLRSMFDKHRRIARITLPVWIYVSVTGVLVYLFLYVWFPAS